MSNIMFGCQTYSWQMSFDKFNQKVEHISSTIRNAGFTGMEAEVCMLGDRYFSDSSALQEVMKQYNLKFAALALPLNWLGKKETDEEFALAEKSMKFVKNFDHCILLLCHLPQLDRESLEERQMNQIKCITDVAARAHEQGIVTAYHPNSSYGSAFRTAEDYDILMEGITNSPLGFAPDAGHIAHGDMDPLEIMKRFHEKIKHIHFKDMDSQGVWRSMGQGCIDFKGIISYLNQINYDGWIMVEEESRDAKVDPDKVTLHNGEYIKGIQ